MAQQAVAAINGHERLCTERWEQSRASSLRVENLLKRIEGDVNRRIGMIPAGAIAALTALCGFLAARAFPLH